MQARDASRSSPHIPCFREALASGRITIARPGGILYRMVIHQVEPFSVAGVAGPGRR